jgi:demethylmenaquinone methyltransferase/2-methoxy-6-polyprenyl-1,4-benzoquinol methylase
MSSAQSNMIDYYAQRASEYERIYHRPERQSDLKELQAMIETAFRDHAVFEVACGTGYWTQFIARQAKSILAIDYNSEVIKIAQQKDYGSCLVDFRKSDAYFLPSIEEEFSAGFSGFWWSHIPKEKLQDFLIDFHSKLRHGAHVVFIDNTYVERNSTPISRKDNEGNTYQIRKLEDGSEHEVLKNFPSDQELHETLSSFTSDLSILRLRYFWMLEYNIIKSPDQSFESDG